MRITNLPGGNTLIEPDQPPTLMQKWGRVVAGVGLLALGTGFFCATQSALSRSTPPAQVKIQKPGALLPVSRNPDLH